MFFLDKISIVYTFQYDDARRSRSNSIISCESLILGALQL